MQPEGDEMHTYFLYTIGKKLLSHSFGVKKPPKPVKEKEFMKFLNQDNKKEKKKKVASYIGELQPENQLQQELCRFTMEEALKAKQDPTKMMDNYQPLWVEKYWYKYWETKNYFHPDAEEALKTDKRYVMVIPPPNVTGYLHLGHALTSAIEDCLIRLHRQRGYATLYLPGIDHAGIATQTVVEKALQKEGISRHQLGREKFLEKVWEWKQKHGNQIDIQLRRVGSSLDWARYRFTMDEALQKSVTEAFIRLQEKGLIYRANRLVNWSCKLKTAISDIEVEFQDIDKPIKVPVPGHAGEYEFGWLTHFAYKVADSDEEIVVATTRLETMLGDVAVAVNSNDPRYKHLHSKKLIHPFIKDRHITVITDDQLVDMAFGTGAVKITPAHDPNDYECGVRNNLEQICIFTDDGRINQNGGQYEGMLRFDCRKKMEEDMKALGIYRKREPNQMRIGFCQRSKDVVEPMIKPQWYVDCQKIKQRMIDVVKNKELIIIPQDFEQSWYQWLTNLRDWCISRQIWWGHRCPAYICTIDGNKPDPAKNDDWVFGRNIEEAYAKAEKKYNVSREHIKIEQDEDVLDTWFSSGLFPFSTMGWPDTENPDFKAFFPNTILETGWDILFFWVARMVHFSLEFFDKLPFKYVFLHPIIRDKDGKKMSKSSGNVIDPLEIIEGTTLESLKKKILDGNLPQAEVKRSIEEKEQEFPEGIPECGSDALRFGLLSYMQKCANVNLDVKRIIGYRQFCNKIWQSVKFALPRLTNCQYNPPEDLSQLALINGWIMTRLNYVVGSVNDQFNDYEFGLATQKFHNFWQYEFCDVYLEGIKYIFSSNDEKLKQQTSEVLLTCIDVGLRLLHPMMPFLSEELWQKLPQWENKPSSICIASYPEERANWKSEKVVLEFDQIQTIARSLRQMAAASNLPPSARAETYLLSVQDKQVEELVVREQNVLTALSRTKSVAVVHSESEELMKCAQGTAGDKIKLYMNLKGQVDVTAESQRLKKKLDELCKLVENLQKKIGQYSEKVPENVRAQDADKMKKYQNESELLKQQIANFEK